AVSALPSLAVGRHRNRAEPADSVGGARCSAAVPWLIRSAPAGPLARPLLRWGARPDNRPCRGLLARPRGTFHGGQPAFPLPVRSACRVRSREKSVCARRARRTTPHNVCPTPA